MSESLVGSYTFQRPPPVPHPLSRYWNPRASAGYVWPLGVKVALCAPPYDEYYRTTPLGTPPRTSLVAWNEASPRGVIVLLGAHTDLSILLDAIAWLRHQRPWLSLAVEVPHLAMQSALSVMLTRVARHGAVVFVGACSPCVVAASVRETFEPGADVRVWLRETLPAWTVATREHAVDCFLEGFRYDPEDLASTDPLRALPRHQGTWMRVGRALHAALLCQNAGTASAEAVALRAGYSDHRAMDRAFLRVFGIRQRDLRGTVGWQWLLWRFLWGEGVGKERHWDQ